MNIKQIFIKSLLDLFPLFIFIIADEIWGAKIGFVLTIGAELTFIKVKEIRFDKFLQAELVPKSRVNLTRLDEKYPYFSPFGQPKVVQTHSR
jgi:hypothetical protein|tara:strand:+ start:353 stop:628 length:276 start_codon:yes stop_codon:yes gene_type:complete